MTTAATLLTLVLLCAGDDPSSVSSRKPHPFAPSLPLLTDAEEDKLDEVIDRFIEYDTGKLKGEGAKTARQDFEKLGPDATFALIRGINKAAKIEHSCPAVTIARKLDRILKASKDPELLEFARENIGVDVGRSRHAGMLRDLRVMCAARKSELFRRGETATAVLATEPAEKDRSLRTLAVDELAKLAAEERGPRLKAVLRELGQRKGDEAVAALAAAAGGYETTIKDLARDQLTRVLSRLDEDTLKATLSDQRPELRRAAILAIQQKKLAWGAELIERLKDDNAEVRDAAHQALVKLPGATDLGPDAKAGTAERTEAVVRWKAWWDKQDHR